MIDDTQQYTAKRSQIKEKLRIVERKIVIKVKIQKTEGCCDRKETRCF